MGGQVIGSLSVIGRTVYAATFDGTTTYGISAKSGRKVFEFHTGAYMPGISDGEKLYLVGYSSIHAMKPITLKQLRAERRAKETRKAAARRPASRQPRIRPGQAGSSRWTPVSRPGWPAGGRRSVAGRSSAVASCSGRCWGAARCGGFHALPAFRRLGRERHSTDRRQRKRAAGQEGAGTPRRRRPALAKITGRRPSRRQLGPHTGPVPILMYHVIGPQPDPRTPRSLSLPPDFQDQVDWLADNGYTAVTLVQVQNAWYDGGTLPEAGRPFLRRRLPRPVPVAMPILEKEGWGGQLNLKSEGSDPPRSR